MFKRMRYIGAVAIAATLLAAADVSAQGKGAQVAPRFEVDAAWPKTLPNNWVIGQTGGIAVDAQDHVWVLQRPRSIAAR